MKIQRKRNALPSEIPYSQLVMERAFVVRLGPNTEPTRGQFGGRVEEVDTAEEVRFRSTEELLRFLGERFDRALRNSMPADIGKRESEETDEE